MGTNILEKPLEVASRLSELGLTAEELKEIAFKAVSARNEAVPVDPLFTPGMFSYIHGVRAMRTTLMLKDGWEMDRGGNMEATFHEQLGVRIYFQNVDKACSSAIPKAIAGKGRAAKQLIEQQNLYLFPEMEAEFQARENTEVWYFCVSVHDEEFRAELSRPRDIVGDQFHSFIERIFIVHGEGWLLDPATTQDHEHEAPEPELEITITRKT